MTRRLWRLLGVIGGAAVVLSAGFVLGLPFASRAQQPAQPAATAAMPPGDNYVGAETCKGCHEEAFNKFSHTRMGRIFLKQARNPQEANACESCHGPGKDHVDAGGGKGKGGLITFAKNDRTPVEKRNAVCLSCHTKGARIFWQGSAHESRDVACTNCHTVMEEHSPRNALAKATDLETCGTCHLKQRAQQMRSSHMPLREGKMGCTSCHNPHGTVTENLLKARAPYLCHQCHTPHGPNVPQSELLVQARLTALVHVWHVVRHSGLTANRSRILRRARAGRPGVPQLLGLPAARRS